MNPRVAQSIEDYLQQLAAAGSNENEIEFARDFLTEAGSAKEAEAEQLLDVKAAWSFVRDVAKRKGAKL